MKNIASALIVLSFATPSVADEPLSAQRASIVLSDYCGPCHGAGSSGDGGIDFIDQLPRLRSSGLIVPGNAAASVIMSFQACAAHCNNAHRAAHENAAKEPS